MNNNKNKNKTLNPFILASCGAISGILTKTLVAPLERVKLLYQAQGYYGTMKYLSITQSIIKIIKEDKIKGLYYGNCANIIRILPAYSLKFMFNDIYKYLFMKDKQKDNNISFKHLLYA